MTHLNRTAFLFDLAALNFIYIPPGINVQPAANEKNVKIDFAVADGLINLDIMSVYPAGGAYIHPSSGKE